LSVEGKLVYYVIVCCGYFHENQIT